MKTRDFPCSYWSYPQWRCFQASVILASNLKSSQQVNTPGLGESELPGLVSVVCLLLPGAVESTFGARFHHSLWWLYGHWHNRPRKHGFSWEGADQIRHQTTVGHHHAAHSEHAEECPHQCNQELACLGCASPDHLVPVDETAVAVRWTTKITNSKCESITQRH
jgi:hypothetical protein